MAAGRAELARRLAEAALRGDPAERLLERFAEGLDGLGVPLRRAFVTVPSLHPLLRARGFRWERDRAIGEAVDFARRRSAPDSNDEWAQSPLYPLYLGAEDTLRYRVERGEGVDRFDLLHDLADEGVTDYLAYKRAFGEAGAGEGVISAWSTDRPGGFTAAEIDLLGALLPHLELAIEAHCLSWSSQSLLATYLGQDVARRVLAGAVERGVGAPLDAVIWTSDLQGFTRLADTEPSARVLDLLNAYSEATVAAIAQAGGEVSKFLGDGILALFPMTTDAPSRALEAATSALASVRRLTAERREAALPVTALRVALHRGEVVYGNVGSRDRLDFTVIGPAVNEATRLCDMCRSLDQALVVSEAFHAAAGDPVRFVGLGRYALRGVERPQALFTLDAVVDAPSNCQ
ncbi:MAG: adenylate/guanylate cyclase domain-containing protein [Pseudomonadota bacterium]